MARFASTSDMLEKPDQNAINLTRLLSRLEQNLLPPEAEKRYNSSYERAKVGANLEHARTLLLRLEHDSAGLKTQSKRQQLQTDLQTKRDQIKQLSQRLYELNQTDTTAETDSDETLSSSDLDGEPTPSYAPAIITSTNTDTDESPSITSTLRSRRPQSTTTTSPSLTTATTTTSSSSSSKTLFSPRPTTATATNPTAQTETLLSHHRTEQESLTASLIAMATALKASTNTFAASLEAEKSVVARAGEGLERSAGGMEASARRMGVLRRMSEGTGWWGRMLLYVWIAALAVVAVLIVGVGPKLRF